MAMAQPHVHHDWNDWIRRNPLLLAALVSVMIHLALFGGWRIGKVLGIWDHQATWLLNWKAMNKAVAVPLAPAEPDPSQVIPLSFVEVDPSTATQEVPKDAKYYGEQNTLAANPAPVSEDTGKTALDGDQEKVIRLADNPRPERFPLQPAEPAEPDPDPTTDPLESRESQEPDSPLEGAANPSKVSKVDIEALTHSADAVGLGLPPAPPPKQRPRTLAQARAQDPRLAGQKTRQEGGVPRRGKYSLDVKQTPFGAYDAAFIHAVEQRWFDLLDSTSFAQRSGKVVVQFNLTSDGRITDMKVLENDVGEILGLMCERAIQDPAPYAAWPSDMRRMIGSNVREVTFTFYYN